MYELLFTPLNVSNWRKLPKAYKSLSSAQAVATRIINRGLDGMKIGQTICRPIGEECWFVPANVPTYRRDCK